MSKEQIQRRWTAYGRKLENDGKGNVKPSVSTENPFDIAEEVNNIHMGDGTKGPFGIPISTGLAVHLIKNMLEVLDKSGHGFFSQFFNASEKESKESEIITQLLLNSMGVTFDKSQLLRIISQPGCEGVRFYHAVRKNEAGDSDSATLVCVGVDKNGYDLNYNSSTPQEISVRQNDTCESLVDDWGHPPGGGSLDFLKNKLQNPRYKLWRMAESDRK